MKELGPTIMRYPGGNFVSGYNWEDGVGLVDKRPARLDLAWFSTEPNSFGTNEFMDWCKAAARRADDGGQSRHPRAAMPRATWSNTATIRAGPTWSDLRRAHGWEKPHDVKFWCLGNEMDGPWQMEYKTATAYGAVAREAAKMMRWVDPTIELAACGSSARNMPSFGHWEDTVIEHTFDHAEYISLHTYLNNYKEDTAAFLACPDLMDSFIDEVVAIADAVAAKRRSTKRMMLSFDEWNVWYRTRRKRADRVKEGWPVAPPILEEIYTMEDALAFGGACISLLEPCRSGEDRMPRPARQRDCADHDRDGRAGMATNHLLSVRPYEPLRSRQGAARAGRVGDLRFVLLRSARRRGAVLPGAQRAVSQDVGGR